MELLKPALKSYTSCYATNLGVETIFLRKDYQVLLIHNSMYDKIEI